MTDVVPAEHIEKVVGVARDQTHHFGRAVSAEETFYILHSRACFDSTNDLRTCEFSKALDFGIDVDFWPLDEPVELYIVRGRLAHKPTT